MRKKVLLFGIMLFFALCSGDPAIAKEKKTTSKQRAAASSKERTDNSPLIPFDITTKKLPPNFAGTDIAKLFSVLLKKAPLKKEEFETTADYEKRIMAAVTGDVYAFKLAPNVGDIHGLTIQPYNADTEKLQLKIETTYLSEYTFEDYRASIIIKHIDGSSRSYIGSNAFGARVLVKSYSGTQFGIALVNQTDFGTSRYDDNRYSIKTPLESVRTINLAIETPPDKAKTLKNNIAVLLLCKPSLHKSNSETKLHAGNDLNDLIFENTFYIESYHR